jgi:hypothetical protein
MAEKGNDAAAKLRFLEKADKKQQQVIASLGKDPCCVAAQRKRQPRLTAFFQSLNAV